METLCFLLEFFVNLKLLQEIESINFFINFFKKRIGFPAHAFPALTNDSSALP